MDCAPTCSLALHGDPRRWPLSVIRSVRQALGPDGHPCWCSSGTTPSDVPDGGGRGRRASRIDHRPSSTSGSAASCAPSRSAAILQRKIQELLGLYKMSWAFSLAGGADGALRPPRPAERRAAEGRAGPRASSSTPTAARWSAQAPGFGFTPEQVAGARYSGGRRGTLALELPQERPARLEQGAGRHAAPDRPRGRAGHPVAPDRAHHARAADPGPARGRRPGGPRALHRRGPEPAAGPRGPGHGRGREPAPARGDQEGEHPAPGVRPAEERVRGHRGPRLPAAPDGHPRLRRARAGGARPHRRGAAGVHAHGHQRDRAPGPARQRHPAHHPDRDRPVLVQLHRDRPRALHPRRGAPRPFGPLGADGHPAGLPEDRGPTPIACGRSSPTSP